jgi:two-component system, NarL family, invasion response regulator UvrY
VIRVLVADDSPSFLAAARDVVAATEGFELAAAAESGEEAVELARTQRFDLALIDVNMPGIGGREAADRIAAESPRTAVLLMTATPDPATPPEAIDKRRLSPATLAAIWDELATPRRSRVAQGAER